MITRAEANEVFSYDEKQGILKWAIDRRAARKGNVAGTNNKGYIKVAYKRKIYGAHRLIWLMVHGEWPNEIDHINGVTDDNRLVNLRAVDKTGNQRNSKFRSANKSGFMGVVWHKASKKWRAQISDGNKSITLGNFEDILEAARIRKLAERRLGYHPYHGLSEDERVKLNRYVSGRR